jgi:hypothetical protein
MQSYDGFAPIPNFFFLFFSKAMDKELGFGQNTKKAPDLCPKEGLLQAISSTKSLFSEVQAQLTVAKEIITFAMIGRDAILLDSLTMLFGGIALIRKPVILGVFLSQTVHVVVAVGLSQDRRGSNRQVFAVALDDGGVGDLDLVDS